MCLTAALQFSDQFVSQKNLIKTLYKEKKPEQTSFTSSCQNWKSPNTALGTRNLVDNIWVSPTGKGEAGRHVSFDLVSCPSFYFPSAEEKSLWVEGPIQPPNSGKLLEDLSVMKTVVNHVLMVAPWWKLCLLPKGIWWDTRHAVLIVMFSQEQIWGQLINLSASD